MKKQRKHTERQPTAQPKQSGLGFVLTILPRYTVCALLWTDPVWKRRYHNHIYPQSSFFFPQSITPGNKLLSLFKRAFYHKICESVSSAALIRALTQKPAPLEEELWCCLGGEKGITHFGWISWSWRLDWGKRLGCLGWSERASEWVLGRCSRPPPMKWAKCCEKDLRQEMSSIRGSHLAFPESQCRPLRWLCVALWPYSLLTKIVAADKLNFCTCADHSWDPRRVWRCKLM